MHFLFGSIVLLSGSVSLSVCLSGSVCVFQNPHTFPPEYNNNTTLFFQNMILYIVDVKDNMLEQKVPEKKKKTFVTVEQQVKKQ